MNVRLKAVPGEEVVKYMLLMEAEFHGFTRKRREMDNFYVIFKEWTPTAVRLPSESRKIFPCYFSTTP
jgi:hypothetical protein